jgi:hypothetical protein
VHLRLISRDRIFCAPCTARSGDLVAQDFLRAGDFLLQLGQLGLRDFGCFGERFRLDLSMVALRCFRPATISVARALRSPWR